MVSTVFLEKGTGEETSGRCMRMAVSDIDDMTPAQPQTYFCKLRGTLTFNPSANYPKFPHLYDWNERTSIYFLH
jgi:hypothetical protein